MVTEFIHRLLMIVPTNRRAGINTWLKSNIDLTGNDWLNVPLNPSGVKTNPITHYWCSAALNEVNAKKLINRLCQLASIATPTVSQWDNATRQQKITWLHNVRANIVTNFGIYVSLSMNEQTWDDPCSILNGRGLKVINSLN